MNGDLLIVVGWNRLIPKKILKLFPLGAIGIHGSSELLPKGRGRSPINWSIIEGKKKFMTQLFFLDEGADAGNIIDFFEFNITEMDDCKTVYYKNAMTAVILLERHLFSILNNKVKSQPQIGKPTFYPKRTPADGIIDWSKDCFVIYNLVRAVTHPYPGAFGHIGKNKVMIWRAHPFDFKIDDSNKAPGEVVEVFPDKNFLVKTGNGLLLVTEYEFNSMENGSKDIRKGDYFEKL
jgi:methionyl-tRNA formyltransferase